MRMKVRAILFTKHLKVSLPLAVLLITFGLGETGASAQTQSSQINPGWTFQHSLFGRNASGSYALGVATVNYIGTFNGTAEFLTTYFAGDTHTQLSVLTRLANGSFSITRTGYSTPFVINKYLDSDNTNTVVMSHKKHPLDWLWAAHNRDNSASNANGAYVWYQYTGGTFPCNPNTCNDFMSVWMGFRTNTGYFFQVEALWGHYTPGGPIIRNAPIFSIGYDSQLGVHNIGQSIVNHQYAMQIFFDILGTSKWYFLIYDETAGQVVYDQPVSGATGTRLNSPYDLEVDMEGSQTYVDATWIPNGQQNFYNLVFFNGPTNYNWVYSPQITHTSDAPTNIHTLVYSTGTAISEIQWTR